MKAFVFPGQGAQFVGMGKDLYDNNPYLETTREKEVAELIKEARSCGDLSEHRE